MDERKKILELIQQHEISSEQGMKLLQLIDSPEENEQNKELNKECINYFKELIAKVTKIPVKNIRTTESFDRYGLDSVVIVSLNEELEKRFGKISQTIFFEYRTVQDLAEYFLKNYREKMLEEIGATRAKVPSVAGKSEKEVVMPKTPAIPAMSPAGKNFFRGSSKKYGVQTEYADGDIAIIGISGMFPLAKDLDEFWSNLETGRDCITEVPKDRWDYNKYYSAENEDFGHIRSKWGGFMENMDYFDPLFFNISPREANYMDPQERLFLKATWNTLEDAGYTQASLANKKVGVFAGVWYGEYQMIDGEEEGKKVVHTSSYSSVANRVSYFFDFNGPCMAVDTMCSSSVTAIHLACDSLRKGESDYAIAGGVNVSGIVPHKYLFLSQGKFLSTDGRCRAFGEGGTGYVPGEGVGTLFLKPLKQAIKDRDNIYAVIKGSAINHGGRTNGFSVPNPVAQGNVIYETLQQSGINPETIGYIEAHGTGTSLGDPIEIKGLVNAFEKYGTQKQYCAIGSVKSNIGHLESAAGVAGIIKVLLQMKHKELVPSIHSDIINSRINFEETPFKLQRKLETWSQLSVIENGELKKYPRRAGISAFGAGGSNAHILIEDYEDTYEPVCEERQIVVLSARSEKQLRQSVQNLLIFINKKDNEKINLGNLAYTLQVGREAMKERLAFLVADLEELKNKFELYLNGAWKDELWWDGSHFACGCVQNEIDEDEVNEDFLISLKREKKYETICNLWAGGMRLAWDVFYRNGDHPRRISLPSYPFDEKKYWVPRTDANDVRLECNYNNKLHPMIDSNESTLFMQCYRKALSTKDFYVRDHVINGKNVLPGVAYLEMARAAAELAGANTKVAKLKNIIWASPIVVEKENVNVFISFQTNEENVAFEISSFPEEAKRVVHASGVVEFSEEDQEPDWHEKQIDINAIQQRCKIQRNSEDFYLRFSKSSFELGSSLKSIQRLYCNENEALAHLVLPEDAEESFAQFVLCPSLMDGALQTFFGIAEFMDCTEQKIYLPFAIEKIDLIRPLQKECYAYLVNSGQNSESKIYDVVLTDVMGNIAVRLSGYMVREIKSDDIVNENSDNKSYNDIAYYENKLVRKEENDDVSLEGDFLIFTSKERQMAFQKEIAALNKRVVFVMCGDSFCKMSENEYEIGTEEQDYLRLCEELQHSSYMPQNIIFAWDNDQRAGLEGALKRSVYSLLFMTKTFMNELKDLYKVRLVYSFMKKDEIDVVLYQAMDGFVKTVTRENPNYYYKIVELDREGNCEKLLISELMNSDEFVSYDSGKRYIRELMLAEMEDSSKENILCKTKVVLITGGMGAIGQIFAKYLSEKYHTKLILTGRSLLNEDIAKKIAKLEDSGAEVLYIPGDISQKEDAERIVNEGIARFGGIDGVIHAAGVTRDSFILKKKVQEFDDVLASKIFGTIYLMEALDSQPIKAFVLCSSISAVIGNMGQSDYAYANRFMDFFAGWCHKKHADWNVISMNWPLWKDGGMSISQSIMEVMKKKMGIVPISTEQGIEAFETMLGSEKSQLVVFAGNKSQIATLFSAKKASATDAERKNAYAFGNEQNIKTGMNQYLQGILSKEIQLSPELIDINEKFENYGIDSVMVMNLSKQLDKDFPNLSKTLFFEYSCINELGDYFIRERSDEVMRLLSTEKSEKIKEDNVTSAKIQNAGVKAKYRFNVKKDEIENSDDLDDIAIIGLGLKYPMANDMEEFWANLKDGRDCITEIPSQRWNYEEYFNADKNHPGTIYSKWGGFIDGIDEFDPMFFKIAAKEAEFMDPQERIFLEVAYHTLEDSGYTKKALEDKKVGVYVGVWFGEYQMLEGESEGVKIAHTSSHASIANRVSYCFDFNGPSIAVDTMCSSSITAIHLACESLRSQDIDVAIAGGVNISGIHPDKYLLLCQGTFVSGDGKCRSFGEGGDGYVPGEGAGAVMLKPLKKAVEDHDRIYGVIKASALNHGGKTSGYSVPNPNAQAEVIEKVLEKAKINPRTIGYIEAHGTGTALGDPIEIQGLTKAFKKYTEDKQFCAVGSVKSNIGHLESAAGIAGITKVLLQMKYKKLVPSIHAENLNPNIDFSVTPFYVQRKYTDWDPVCLTENGITNTYKRRAGVSSFGAGGANAHIILEEYDECIEKTEECDKSEYLIVLSAWDEERLKDNTYKMLEFINSNIEDVNILENVRKLFANIVCMNKDEIDLDEPISEYVDDILKLTELASLIDDEYQMDLTVFDLRESGSIKELCALIQRNGKNCSKDLNANSMFMMNLEYALQNEKEEMFERIAMVVSNVSELIDKLTRYCQGDADIERFYRGNTRERIRNLEQMKKEKLEEVSVEELIRSQNYEMLAKLWVLGTKIEWITLYGEKRLAKRLKLPVYSFAKEKYWGVNRPSKKNQITKCEFLHPLVQKNTSNFRCIRFESDILKCPEFFLGTTLDGQRILPVSVIIEMIRIAAGFADEKSANIIEDMRLAGILAVNDDSKLSIHALPVKNSGKYEVCDESQNFVYAQAEAKYVERLIAKPELKTERRKEEPDSVYGGERDQIYEAFDAQGYHYGEWYSVLEKIDVSQSCAVARLNMRQEEYRSVLLIEAMIQTAQLFLYRNQESESLVQVSGIQGLEIVTLDGQEFEICVKRIESQKSVNEFSLSVIAQNERGEQSISMECLTLRRVF